MGVFLDLSKSKWALVTLEYLLVELGPLGRTDVGTTVSPFSTTPHF